MTCPGREATSADAWLQAWQSGDSMARGRLVALLYPELRRLAGFHLGRQPGRHTLQATELLHEAYLRIVDQRQAHWRDRAHFLAIASRIMRRVLLDRSRRRLRQKRGGGAVAVPLTEISPVAARESVDYLALETALGQLEAEDPLAARVVEMRFFAGLSYDEIAEVLDLGRATAARRWRFARAWLHRRLSA